MSQLDLSLAISERDSGVEKVARPNQTFIKTFISVARIIARKQCTFTADDLRDWLDQYGPEKSIEPPTHYNAWGSLFRNKEFRETFEFAGYATSRQVQGHGNQIRVWKLK